MGFQELFQNIAGTMVDAFGDIATTVYYHSAGTMSYSPSTGTYSETDAVSVSATDISVDGSNNKLISTSTVLSSQNIPIDGQYVKISGFTSATNNCYASASATAATSVTINTTDVDLFTEAAGGTVVITGPYHKVDGILQNYNQAEYDNNTILFTDQRLMIPNNDISVTPKETDYILIDSVEWKLQRIKIDPAEAMWDLQLRKP